MAINFDFRSGAKKSGYLDYPLQSYGSKEVRLISTHPAEILSQIGFRGSVHRPSTELQKNMYSNIAFDVKWTFKFCWDSQCLLHLYCRHPASVCQSIMATNIQSVMATNIQSIMATNIQSVRKRKERTDQQPTFSRVKTFTVFGLPLHNGMLIKLICDLLSTFLIETTENNKSSFPTCIKKTQAWQAGGG